MKAISFILFVLGLRFIYGDVTEKWNEFRVTYMKNYGTELEVEKRFKLFANNWEEIEKHNALYRNGRATYTKSINQFTDWSPEEFMDYLQKGMNVKPVSSRNTFNGTKGFSIPRSVDWRSKNAVTDVKNQGLIGSSCPYSVTGSVEGQLGIEKTLISLSEENLVDCTCKEENDLGCINKAYDYIIDNGIESTEDYAQSRIDGQCTANITKIVTKLSGYFNIEEGNEYALQEAIATKGPISAAIDVTNALMMYGAGIFSDNECDDSLNHTVLVVGYGIENGNEYYIVKNSWGSAWGENGYFRLIRNRNNTCGIATFASYPVL